MRSAHQLAEVLVEVARAALDADVLLEDHLQDQGDSVGVGEGEGW